MSFRIPFTHLTAAVGAACAILIALPVAARAQVDNVPAINADTSTSPAPDAPAPLYSPAARPRGPMLFYGVVAAGTLAAFQYNPDPDAGGYEDGWLTSATFPDKVVHALASFALTTVGVDAGARPWMSAGAVCAAGAAFEYSQGYASRMDMAANCVGAGAAALWRGWSADRRERLARPAPDWTSVASVTAHAGLALDVHPGDTVRIFASAHNSRGGRIAGASMDFMIASRGEQSLPASIDTAGLFVADSTGLFNVLVQSGNTVARVPLLVTHRPAKAVLRSGAIAPGAPAPGAGHSAAMPRGISVMPSVRVSAAPPAPTTRVRIASPDYVPYVGTTVRFGASIWTEESSAPDSTRVPAWSTSDPARALVDDRGRVMFLAPGPVTITATHGGHAASRRVHATRSPAAQLLLRSDANYTRAGDIVKLIDHSWQRGGRPVLQPRTNFAITRNGSHTRDAWISEEGRFVAHLPGEYTVLSELGGIGSSVTFTVYPAGGRCELQLRKWDPSCSL